MTIRRNDIINSNNYEEFFVLYADGELSPEEIQAVNDFLVKNPNLKEELDLLIDLHLSPNEEIKFEGRLKLLKPEAWDADALNSMQTDLLTKLDGELETDTEQSLPNADQEWQWLQLARLPIEPTPMPHKYKLIKLSPWNAEQLTAEQSNWLELLEARNSVPNGVLADPIKMKEWRVLQQTLLPQEFIAMQGKQRLYRRESQLAPVSPGRGQLIYLPWVRRIAVAAAVVIAGWFAFNLFEKPKITDPELVSVTKNNPSTPQPVQQIASSKQAEKISNQNLKLQSQANPASKILANNQPRRKEATLDLAKQPLLDENKVDEHQKSLSVSSHHNSNGNSVSYEEIAAFRLEKSALKGTQKSVVKEGMPMETLLANTTSYPITAMDKSWYAVASTTSEQTNLDAEPVEDHYVNIGGAKINRQKLRSVVRPLTRLVNRNFSESQVTANAEPTTKILR